MKPYRIEDNSKCEVSDFSDIAFLLSKIENKTLKHLEREGVFVFPDLLKGADDLEKDQIIIQKIDNKYRTGNIMGFLGYGDKRLIIESRFSNNGKDFLFLYLLSNILDIPNIMDLRTDADQSNKLFNYLLFLFPFYLKSAMRKGLFKTYIRRNYNDGNLRGPIDIARHIEKNTPFIGNIAYSKREFSFDNSLIELIRHTIEYIKRKPCGSKVLLKIKDEVELITAATTAYKFHDRERIIEQNKKTPVRHAYYREYLALQKLCIAILQDQRHQVGQGTKEIYGILFDGAWLWEEYVNSLIKESFYHPKNKGKTEGAQRLFSTGDSKLGLIYPDFISKNPAQRIIVDAKYKPMDNIGNKDYLQVLAYMYRFDSCHGYYVYPESNNEEKLELHLNQGSTYDKSKVVKREPDILVTKLGIKIPGDVSNYEEFVNSMKIQENKLRQSLVP